MTLFPLRAGGRSHQQVLLRPGESAFAKIVRRVAGESEGEQGRPAHGNGTYQGSHAHLRRLPEGQLDIAPREIGEKESQCGKAKHCPGRERRYAAITAEGKNRLVPQIGAVAYEADAYQWAARQQGADQ